MKRMDFSKKVLTLFGAGWLLGAALLTGAARAEEGKDGQGTALEAATNSLSLGKALRAAEDYSPAVRASQAREEKARGAENFIGAYDYPDLFVSAVDSRGYPGYFAPQPIAFDGLLNSPYRVGAGADLVLRWNLFDISRWHELDWDRHKVQASRENTKIERLKLDQRALELYLTAALYRGQREAWKDVEEKAEGVLKVAKDFVRTGQYNEDKMLNIEVEKEEATVGKVTSDESYHQTLARLAILTGLDLKDTESPLPADLNEGELKILSEGDVSPYITFASDEIEAAKSNLARYSTERLPKLYVMGSAGLLEGSQLVQNQDYAVWAGVTMPIFDELRIGAEEKQESSEKTEQEERLKDAHLMVDDLNRQYDEKVSVARAQIPLLEIQIKDSLKAFRVARERFLSYRGTVTDVREALRELGAAETEMNEARIDLLMGLGSKILLNGGTVLR